MINPERHQGGSAGKDSFLRTVFKKPLEFTSKKVHKTFPSLTPNHITVAGLGMVIAGAAMIENVNGKHHPDKKTQAAALALQGLGYLCDGLDGGVARQLKDETDGKYNNPVGVIFDVTADRVQESALAFLRSKSAVVRKDMWGQIAADGVMLTTSLPTLTREMTMWLDGHEVHELGTDVIAFFGSRPGRIIMNTLSGMSTRVQPYIDSLQVGANLYSAYNRYKTRGEKIDDSFRKISRDKSLALLPVAGASTVIFAVNKSITRK